MRLPASEARAFVFGPWELATLLTDQFRALGIAAEIAPTPQNEAELSAWLSAHASETSTFVHPGLSFWADRPEFAQIVNSVGFFPVTPSARTLSLCLNKLNLLIEAEAAGIPHLAIAFDPLSSLREIEDTLKRTGEKYPIVLKSLKVAQGHGIQVVYDEKQLREIVPVWFEQLSRRYGEASVMIERCLPSARHLVVPFAADQGKFLEIFPVMDASLQTRWRRLIQFIPAMDLGPQAEAAIEDAIRKWVKHLGFSGFGSMEFLIDGDRVYIIDANARLNAAFPIWEELLGVRTIEWQLASLGQLPLPKPRLKDRPPTEYGFGVSLRFYAEDPVRQIPCPGKIRAITGPGRWKEGDSSIIWMTRYKSGEEVTWTSSGVIGELIVLGKDRKSTLASACSVLRELWIAGSIQTNQRFLLEHLEHPFVRENLIHAGFTDEDFVPDGFPSVDTVREVIALASAAFPCEGARWAVGNQWIEVDGKFAKRHEADLAKATRFSVGNLEGLSGSLERGDGKFSRFHFEPTQADRWLVTYGTWPISIRRVKPSEIGVKKAPGPKTKKILALAPGRVHALLRHVGETLQPRDRACMIESIGILVPHAVPVPAKLIEWKVAPGEIVEAGRELAVFELLG